MTKDEYVLEDRPQEWASDPGPVLCWLAVLQHLDLRRGQLAFQLGHAGQVTGFRKGMGRQGQLRRNVMLFYFRLPMSKGGHGPDLLPELPSPH